MSNNSTGVRGGSRKRLESQQKGGQFAFAQKALRGSHEIAAELGFDLSTAKSALAADIDKIESIMRPAELEAIIRVTNRPPMIVRNGKVEYIDLPVGPTEFPAGIEMKIRAVEPLLAAVGRVEFINFDMEWGGTGWVVGKEKGKPGNYLVVTNRHVAELVARRSRNGEASYMLSPGNARYGAQIDFNEEVDAPTEDARIAKIERFIYLADDASADVALGRITIPTDFKLTPIELGKEGQDREPVAVVGYPAKDAQRNDPANMERYFRGLYDVKRFSPGLLRVGGKAEILTHDCTTLGGNSGSPVISLAQGKAVGLHFAGKYGVGNSAVRASTLKALVAGQRPVQVQLGIEATLGEARDGDHPASFFKGRDGYDANFLGGGLKAPLPKLPRKSFNLARPSDATKARPHELRYTHFSVVYCQDRKSPVVAAVNIDGKNSKSLKREGDKWFFDLRIPKETQIGQDAYSDELIDRGHMVRREDPNWGDAKTVAKANFDTFHYTNSALQHAKLNRSRATWQGLENYILDSARTHGFKACVMTGPVFTEDDPMLEEADVPVPLEFWKVVVMRAAGGKATRPRLHCTAYMLSQGQLIHRLLSDRSLTESVEGFVYGEYKTYQVAIKDLEAGTGYDFGALRRFDPLARKKEEESLAPTFIEIERPSHIIL